MKNLIITFGVIGGMLITVQPILADTTPVDSSRYDMSVRSDVSALHSEIVKAAADICDVEARKSDYRGLVTVRKLHKRCVSDLTDSAVQESGEEQLVSYHRSKNGEQRY